MDGPSEDVFLCDLLTLAAHSEKCGKCFLVFQSAGGRGSEAIQGEQAVTLSARLSVQKNSHVILIISHIQINT